RGPPSTTVALDRSHAKCAAVAALPPLPSTNTCRRAACARRMASTTSSTALTGTAASACRTALRCVSTAPPATLKERALMPFVDVRSPRPCQSYPAAPALPPDCPAGGTIGEPREVRQLSMPGRGLSGRRVGGGGPPTCSPTATMRGSLYSYVVQVTRTICSWS